MGPNGNPILLLAGFGSFLVVGTLKWVEMNDYASRYVQPTFFCVLVALWLIPAAAVSSWFERLGSLELPVLLATLLVPATAGSGWPGVRHPREELDHSFGELGAALLASPCTHLAGDYWVVWPAVFHANLVARERGLPRRFWAVSHRAWPTYESWPSPDKRTFCAPQADTQWATYLREYEVGEARALSAQGNLRVLELTSPPSSDPPTAAGGQRERGSAAEPRP